MNNKILTLAFSLFALNLATGYGQTGSGPGQPPPVRRLVLPAAPAESAPPLTKFNLDFSGGTPTQLVQAIEKAMGKPLNVIINKEDDSVEIPPIKLNDVTLPQLFSALEAASRKEINISWRPGSSTITSYGFKNDDNLITDTSIWYFHANLGASKAAKECRFFSLAPFIEKGYTVEDITTAIQTGWKLEGETAPPELNYHKETRLLIACGESAKLETITRVLNALPPESSSWAQTSNDHLRAQVQELRQQVESFKKQQAAGTAGGTSAGSTSEKAGK